MSEIKPKLSLAKDLLESSKSMTVDQARFLVDTYYQIQDARIRASAQVRSLVSSEEPHSLLDWVGDVNAELENKIKRTLEIYAKHNAIGQWSLGVTGIGPVIAAGLLAHIDITQAPTVGHIWRYAGQDPTSKWEKVQKRPWNASLKTLCGKIGESFVKVSGNKKDIYGQHYLRRKEQEIIKNENLDFKEQADIKATKVGKTTDAYKSYSVGKLPKAHIHARAKRYAVKLFLAHWHEVAFREHYKAEPPLPYPIAHLGHAHHIKAA